LIKLLKILNVYWIKATSPDWHLLGEKQMHRLFDGADDIIIKKVLFSKKEIIAYKSNM